MKLNARLLHSGAQKKKKIRKQKMRMMIWIMLLSNASPLHHMSPGRNLLRFTTAALRTLAARLVNEKTFYWVRFHSPHRFIPLCFFLSFFFILGDIKFPCTTILPGNSMNKEWERLFLTGVTGFFFGRVSNITPSPIIIQCLEFWAHDIWNWY